MSISRKLAELVLNTERQQISPAALDSCRKLILDTVAVALAGSKAPGVENLRQLQLELGGSAQASVLGFGDKFSLPDAVFLNSVMIHALDFDDIYSPGNLHIMSTVFPVALGSGEFLGKIMVIGVIRELGPLVTSFIIIGRSGAALSTYLGNMKIANELDALAESLSDCKAVMERANDKLYVYTKEECAHLESLLADTRRWLRRPANLEDLFIQLTGRSLRES